MAKNQNVAFVYRRFTDGQEELVREYPEDIHGEDYLKLAKQFVAGRKAKGQEGYFVKGHEEEVDENLGDVESYDDLNVKQLKAECEARKIILTGKEKKPDLVALLEGDDEAKKDENK